MAGRAALLAVLFVFLSANSLFVGVCDAQSCKEVVRNANSTTNAKLASPVFRVAQRLDVQANLTMLHFTAVFSPSQTETKLTLDSVALYTDDGLQPRIPLADGAFNSTGAPINGDTHFRFNTTNGGTALANGTRYWLVLAFIDGGYRELQGSTIPYDGAAIGGLIGLGGRVMVELQQEGGWVDSTEVVALSIDIFACLQPAPSASPLASLTPSPPVATPTRSPTPMPTPTPSASPAPAVSPLATGVEVDFGGEEPTFDLSVPRSSGTKVGGSFLGLAVDGWSLDLRPYEVSVVNTTVGGAGASSVVETHTYASLLADNVTTFAQIFAFYPQAVDDTAFDALDLTIRPNTVKWSINITTACDNASSLSQQPFSISYRLADLTATEAGAAMATATAVVKRRGEPRANMTTYYVPLASSGKPLVAVVEVFDVALADEALVPLVGHDVRLASASLSRREQAAYELVLEFAPFNRSLYYDPSLGLGVLLGRSDAAGDGEGDDDNLALVVATSVVIPTAFVLVVGAVVVGVAVLWWRKKRANTHLQHQIDQMRDNSAL